MRRSYIFSLLSSGQLPFLSLNSNINVYWIYMYVANTVAYSVIPMYNVDECEIPFCKLYEHIFLPNP